MTLKEIAREAGVSHGTVSNVLNKTGKVRDAKIRLVEEAAKKLGLPVKLHDEQADRIFPDTLMIDDRVTDELRQAVRGLKLV